MHSSHDTFPAIVFNREKLRDYAFASSREWLLTNGIGGFASSTLSGSNTRRYHALLVATLKPPLDRKTFLSKVEETISVDEMEFELSSNQYPGVIHPMGHLLLDSFTDAPCPTFIYRIKDRVSLRKRIWMQHGGNTVYLQYRLLESHKPVHIRLAPLICWKDYHQEMRRNSAPSIKIKPIPTGVCVEFGTDARSLRLISSHMQWETADYWHQNIEHQRERERGMDWMEDIYCPVHFFCDLQPNRDITFLASADDGWLSPNESFQRLVARGKKILKGIPSNNPFITRLALAADCFRINRFTAIPNTTKITRSTILAGYHWFSDWSRDTMISLPGICISTGEESTARDILLSHTKYIDEGMLPNRFPDAGDGAEYNNVDGTLWFFQAIWEYLHGKTVQRPDYYSKIVQTPVDMDKAKNDFLRQIIPSLMEIVKWHIRGTRYDIHMDAQDHLLWAGMKGTQLTWMDARIGKTTFTPRVGKPVEVNALWCNALHILAKICALCGMDAELYEDMAQRADESFQKFYPRPDGMGLFDVIGNDTIDLSIRPNQIFAISLPFSPLVPDQWERILTTVRDHLLTPVGLRTLSPKDPAYRETYGGNAWERDSAYHQGTVWPWLLSGYALAHYRAYSNLIDAAALFNGLERHLEEAGIGSISEVFDGNFPHAPNGTIAQAWSVAEILRAKMILMS